MFKLFAITILTIVTYSGALEHFNASSVEGILLESKYRDDLPPKQQTEEPTKLECPANKDGLICANDCKTLMVCKSKGKLLLSNECSDLSPNLPYCIPGKNKCSEIGDPDNAACSSISDFECTNEGYFPDPKDCTKYYVCSDDMSHTYVCPENYVYDVTSSRCVRKQEKFSCKTINCKTSPNKFVTYPGNKAYYAFCNVKSGNTKVIMFRCTDTTNYEFNKSTMSCDFICKAEGQYPDNDDCKKYYECYKSKGKFVNRFQTCPKSTIFNATQTMCVKGECSDKTRSRYQHRHFHSVVKHLID